MVANVLPLRVARRLQTAFETANVAARTWMDQRATALEMLGLNPDDLTIGIDFNTGMVQVTSSATSVEAEAAKPPVTEPADKPPMEPPASE